MGAIDKTFTTCDFAPEDSKSGRFRSRFCTVLFLLDLPSFVSLRLRKVTIFLNANWCRL